MRSAFLWTAAAALTLLGACGDDDDPEPGLGVAEPRSFVEVGSGMAVPDLEPLWLDDDAARTSAVQALTDQADRNELEPEQVDDAVDALEAPAPEGTRGAAFLLPGCAETGAQLSVAESAIDAELTGGEDINCDAPVYFLVIFDIPNDAIPDNAHLE